MKSPQDDTPAELKGITEVLEKSLQPSKEDEIPPMPDDLRERLKGQYSEKSAQAEVAAPVTESLWSRLRTLFAQPAVSGALAAVVLVGVLMSFLLGPDQKEPGNQMRGGETPEAVAPTIVILYDLSEEQAQAVRESGYFEEKHLLATDLESELSQWVAQEGMSIVVDGAAGEIRHEDGRVMSLPASDVSEGILEMLEN